MTAGCRAPLDLAILTDYWFGEVTEDADQSIELHLLECDACGDLLRWLVALRDGTRHAARHGLVPLIVTASFLESAARAGLRTREYRVPAGGRVACTVTSEDDLLVGRMVGDFKGVEQLDILLQIEGAPDLRLPDVPVSPDAQELIWAQAMPAARAMGRVALHVSLVAREGDRERLVGDYLFDHHPTPGR